MHQNNDIDYNLDIHSIVETCRELAGEMGHAAKAHDNDYEYRPLLFPPPLL